MSLFDEMMHEAADVLLETHGEGETPAITYQPPKGNAFELVGWILGELTHRPEPLPRIGGLMQVQLRTLKGKREDLTRHDVSELQYRAIVHIGDEQWHIDEETSRWDATFVTLGLRREPLAHFSEGRHAPV